jgi:DNA (cytosine-5)-methyltransferase 1
MSEGTVVDLFCGAGGASLGFVKAGFEVIGAVDADATALDTYRKNLCETDLDEYPGEIAFDEPLAADLSRDHQDKDVDDDLPTVTFADIRDEFGLKEGDVDVICGCPPCQNFSSLRDTKPWPEDKPKDSLLQAFVEFIEEEVPDVVFFENVRNIMSAGSEENPTTYVDWLIRNMGEITREGDSSGEGGYGVELDVVNAANYGVPQRRRRTIGLFVYGADGDEISLPDPTHAEDPDADEELESWRTVGEWLDRDWLRSDLESGERQDGSVEGYEADPAHRSRNHHTRTIERMRAIRRHGSKWRDLQGTDDEEYIVEAHRNLDGGAGSEYGIIDANSPAPTLTTRCTTPSCGRFTHPEQNRGLTFREAALLMTFPREFELPDKNDAAERVVGNAVPPRMVRTLAEGLDT